MTGSGRALVARAHLLGTGAIAVTAGAAFIAFAPDLRIPVPLNQAGATAATSAVVAYVATLPWIAGASRRVPESEWPHRRRVIAIRLTVAGVIATILAALVSAALGSTWLGSTGLGSETAVARFGLQCAFFLGLGYALSPTPSLAARWLPGFTVVAASLVLGVNRDALEPYRWAWLLHDAPTITWVDDVPQVLALVVGAAVMAITPPRAQEP